MDPPNLREVEGGMGLITNEDISAGTNLFKLEAKTIDPRDTKLPDFFASAKKDTDDEKETLLEIKGQAALIRDHSR